MGRCLATARCRTAKIPVRHDSRQLWSSRTDRMVDRRVCLGAPWREVTVRTQDPNARSGCTTRKWAGTQIWRAGEPMLGGILGSLVWFMANLAYGSHVRDGERGFKRFAAFWLGFPLTLCSAFVIKRRGRITKSRRDEFEEERELLMEIRRDRALRLSRGQRADEGTDGAGHEKA